MSRAAARRAGRQTKRQQVRKQNNTPLIIGGVVLVIAILIGVGLYLANNSAITGEQHIADQGYNLHIQNVNDPHPAYNSNPPTSGWHYGGGTAPWGISTQPISDELTVHNIEHGGIVIHYRQDLDQASVTQLTTLARTLQQQNPCIVMLPRPVNKLETPIAVTAWNYLLPLQTVDTNEITKFFKAHIGRGPEAVCTPS